MNACCVFSVQTEQVTNVEKCTSLEIKMKENMKVLENGQKDILDYKRQLQMSYAKVMFMVCYNLYFLHHKER